MSLFHQHLLVRCHVERPPIAECELNDWLTQLVAKVGMKVCLPPHSKFVDTIGNEGLTGNIGLETSHAALHCWSDVEPALIQMDLYSCKEFDTSTVIEHLNTWGVIDYELMEIDRNDGFSITQHFGGKS